MQWPLQTRIWICTVSHIFSLTKELLHACAKRNEGYASIPNRSSTILIHCIAELLGISKDSTASEIKKAYHRAALSSHPDKKPEHERDEAEIHFKAISKAYEILSDDSKRSVYDVHGMAAFENGGASAGHQHGHGFGAEVNMEDLFEQMFSGGAAGGRRRPQQQDRKGEDDVSTYEVTLEELYKGKTTKFTVTKRVVCGSCSGSGGRERAKARKCGTCDGKGELFDVVGYAPSCTIDACQAQRLNYVRSDLD